MLFFAEGLHFSALVTFAMNHNYVIFNQLHVLALQISTGDGLDCVMGGTVSASIHTDEKLSFWNAYWPGKRILGKRPLLFIKSLVCLRFSLFFPPNDPLPSCMIRETENRWLLITL